MIEIAFGNKSVKVRVTDVKDTVKNEEAADMFEYLQAVLKSCGQTYTDTIKYQDGGRYGRKSKTETSA